MKVRYGVPYMVVWETTFQCNMRCIHCGSSCDVSRSDELTTDEALVLCDQIAALGTYRAVLSGGETFMRKDWPVVADRLIRGGVKVSVITNGLAITRSVIDNLIALRSRFPATPVAIHLSVDGIGESHDFLRGVTGAFVKLLNKMALLRHHGIPFSVVTTIHRRNAGQLADILGLIRRQGAYAWQMQAINVYGRARENDQLTITPETYYDVVHEIARLKQENPDFRIEPSDCIGYFGPTEKILRGTPWSGCHAGLFSYGIQSNGNVKGCLSMIDDCFVEGNLREESLHDIWHEPGNFAFNREFTPEQLKGACRECAFGPACRAGCSAMAHSYTGSCFENKYCVTAIEVARGGDAASRAA